jgi:hypothetical protein
VFLKSGSFIKLHTFLRFFKGKLKGIVSQDLMRIKRPADAFIGKIISPRYSRIGFIFNFTGVFIFKFLNSYAQPASLWEAHVFWNVTVSKCSSGTWGDHKSCSAESASLGAPL